MGKTRALDRGADAGRQSQRHRTRAASVDTASSPTLQARAFPAVRLSGRDAQALRDGHGYLHDLRHQVGTVTMLAAALEHRTELDAESRRLTEHLVAESRRLDDLLTALTRHPSPGGQAVELPPTVRLDELIHGLTEPFLAVDGPRVRVLTTAAVVRHNPTTLWRAVRNLFDNAWVAAGRRGRIEVRLFIRDGFAVVDIADDGPGMRKTPPRDGARGLDIVDTLARGWGGWVEFSTSRFGGCRSRLFVPLWHERD